MLLKIPVFRASRESNNANIEPFLQIFPVNCLLSGNSRVRLVRHGLRRAPYSPVGLEKSAVMRAARERCAFLRDFWRGGSPVQSETRKTRLAREQKEARSRPGIIVTAVDIAVQNPSATFCSCQCIGSSMRTSIEAVSFAG